MSVVLPNEAGPIYVEWVTREGGVSVLAFTDKEGRPFLGVCALNRMGKMNGLPCWFRRTRFCSDVVIGFRNETPIVVRIYTRVNAQGLELVVRLPRGVNHGFEYRAFSSWDSEPPQLRFLVAPSSTHTPVNPFPADESNKPESGQ